MRAHTKRMTCSWIIIPVLAFFLFTSMVDAQAQLDNVIKAASKEGALTINAPASVRAPERAELAKAFTKKYGLNIKVQIDPSGGSMLRRIARVAQEVAVGQAPTWDVLLQTDFHYSVLTREKLLQPFDWTAGFGIDPRFISYNGNGIAFATQFILPAYNTELVRKEDIPRSWDDLLNPKWKGRIGVNNATHHWARLAQTWGEERTEQFLQRLKEQNPQLGSLAEIYTKLQLGEVMVAASLTHGYIHIAQQAGAPVRFADVEPVVAAQYMAGVVRGAKNPNAARLFIAFLLSKEGQDIWRKVSGEDSVFIEGGSSWTYAQGRQILLLDSDFALKKLSDLQASADKTLGFRR